MPARPVLSDPTAGSCRHACFPGARVRGHPRSRPGRHGHSAAEASDSRARSSGGRAEHGDALSAAGVPSFQEHNGFPLSLNRSQGRGPAFFLPVKGKGDITEDFSGK